VTALTTPFPAVIDSSMIAAFRSCPTRARYEYFEHWKSRYPSVHLHAGKAFAAGTEATRLAYYLGDYKIPVGDSTYEIDKRAPGNEQASIACGLRVLLAEYGNFECPPESAKSAERMAGAFEYFFSAFRLSDDKAVPVILGDRRGIEVSFTEPLDFAHPVTGDPLLFTGRLDMFVEYAGQLFGEDDKTTSQLGASWSRQWDLRSQFIAYSWGVRKLGYPIAGFLIRGISILKTKYDSAQAIVYFPQWLIDEWYEQLIERDLPAMVRAWESQRWGKSLAEACNEYGGCGFKPICQSEPSSRTVWLESSYERRRWDPVTRTETKL
jgi:hypothetical protein